MPFDHDKYRHNLKPLSLLTEQENEILELLRLLSEESIASEFNEHTVQTAINTRMQPMIRSKKPSNVIHSLCPIANKAFQNVVGSVQ